MSQQESSFQQQSSESFHQQQQGFDGGENAQLSSVKNLVNKFDNDQQKDLAFGGAQVQQQSSTTITSASSGAATAIGQSQAELIDFESAEEHERRARELREKAMTTLKTNEEEFSQAERAQAAARLASEQANLKTQQALENQERGQQLLAEAGARLIEAGAKLQQEAAAIKREVPFNVHQQGEVRQTTCVSSAGVEAAAHAREVSTFREIQPAQTTTSANITDGVQVMGINQEQPQLL